MGMNFFSGMSLELYLQSVKTFVLTKWGLWNSGLFAYLMFNGVLLDCNLSPKLEKEGGK